MSSCRSFLFIWALLLVQSFSLASADTIVLRNGAAIESNHVWEDDGKVFCERYGGVVSYSQESIDRIEKGNSFEYDLGDTEVPGIPMTAEVEAGLDIIRQRQRDVASGKVADCYQAGYDYGECGARTLFGLPCSLGSEGALPEECRETDAAKRGILAGTKAVYEEMGLY